MMRLALPRYLLLLVPLVVFTSLGEAAPPETFKPTEEQLQAIHERSAKLEKALGILRRQGVRDPFFAEIEIYWKAADWITRHNEFYQKEAVAWTIEALDRGLLRANQQGAGESPWLAQRGQPVVRAYRSRIDNSVQPYAVTFPADYAKDLAKRWRVDVVLHGRNARLTEVSFLHQFNGDRLAPKDLNHIQIDIYGRGNNAYRWAGEMDVYEAIDHFLGVEKMLRRENLVDSTRVVLRGFSMGGAGTWHLGLHRPDRWCVLGPGAGFTVTKGYAPAQLLPNPMPSYIEDCLHIYDAADYAENIFDVPVVAYSGEKDKQIEAVRNIEARLKGTNLSIVHLIAPGLEHKFPAEWQQKAEQEYAKYVAKGRTDYPKRVRFVTWTLRYANCDWVHIVGLEEHYKKALVDAEQLETHYEVKTSNVRVLNLTMPPGSARHETTFKIDGEKIVTRPVFTSSGEMNVFLEKRQGHWYPVIPQRLFTKGLRTMQKLSGLHGPIDDAFTQPFVCVRGTQKPWHEATQKYADQNLKRFQGEWDRYFRGELPVVDDNDLSGEDISRAHLILFGDPSSNRAIAQVIDGLPIEWTKDSLVVNGHKYDAKNHVPVLIFPSPLNPERYVVINSGHTFRAADLEATNAMLFPRLGDWAVLQLDPTESNPLNTKVMEAGIFDDFWKFKKK